MDTVMSILDEAIVIHGADGELVFANPAAARMLGYETSEDAVSTPRPRRSATATRSATSSGNEVGARRRSRAAGALRGEPAEPQTLRAIDRETGERALDADQGAGDRGRRRARSSTR